MCYLTTVVGSFHGRVLAARLGAEGVLVMLKGTTDGPYPLPSAVDVLVPADQLKLAREILLADAVDDAFGDMGLDEFPDARADQYSGRFSEVAWPRESSVSAFPNEMASSANGSSGSDTWCSAAEDRRRPARVRGPAAAVVVLLVATMVIVACVTALH